MTESEEGHGFFIYSREPSKGGVHALGARIAEIDVFQLDTERREWPDAGNHLPRGVPFIKAGNIIRVAEYRLVGSDTSLAAAGTDINTQWVIGERSA